MPSWCARPTRFSPAAASAVQKELAGEMDKASGALDFERAAIYRDRLAALSAIQSHQGINPRTVEEADVFAVHQDGGYTCVEVFFFRTGQNWGNRAYFPKADRALGAGEVLERLPRAVLRRQAAAAAHPGLARVRGARAAGRCAVRPRAGRKVEVGVPQRGERKELVQHALANAREALARKLADTSSQQTLLKALTETFALPREPRRIEVYDNSHIAGTNAVGAMIVAGPEGFRKNQYRKFNIRSAELTPGDDYGMMREVLQRRFKRLLAEAPRLSAEDALAAELSGEVPDDRGPAVARSGADRRRAGPACRGGGDAGRARRHRRAAGRHRQGAGPRRRPRDLLHGGQSPFKLPPRDPLLYFIERLRDEAHRFAIGSHRARRKKDIREAGLQEIPGIGPDAQARAAAPFRHCESHRAGIAARPAQVPGINAETARKIYEFFHEQARDPEMGTGYRIRSCARHEAQCGIGMIIQKQEDVTPKVLDAFKNIDDPRAARNPRVAGQASARLCPRRASDRRGIREGASAHRRARADDQRHAQRSGADVGLARLFRAGLPAQQRQ